MAAAAIDEAIEDDIDHKQFYPAVSWRRLLSVSGIALIRNVAAPLAAAAQTALIGRATSIHALAAFTITTSAANTGEVVFNYLVVGVASRVGAAYGGGRHDLVGARSRIALLAGVIAGAFASFLLLLGEDKVFAFFSGQEASMSSVTAMARLFYRWRVSIVSLYLVNNATQGVLQGVDCVRAAAAIASARAVLDVMATVAALGIGGALFDSSDGQSAIGDGGDAYVLGLVGAAMAVSAGMSMLVALVAVAIRVKGMRDWTNWRSGGKLQGEVSEFATDGVSMFVRTALLQGTFLIALACVCRLGAAATAAHAVILQLWSLGSFSVDGFADAGTIIGSHVSARAEKRLVVPALRRMCRRLLGLGLTMGIVLAAVLYVWERPVARIFTHDEAALLVLHDAWPVLTFAQPVNALAFVYDGLLLAAQGFAFARESMITGTGLVFGPVLVHAYFIVTPTLAGIWTAKVALNVWRVLALGSFIHLFWLRVPKPESTLLYEPLSAEAPLTNPC